MYIESPMNATAIHRQSDPVIEYHHRHHAPGTVPNGKEKNTGPVKREKN